MGSAYLRLKALHIVSLASRFAGRFHLTRLFFDLATVGSGSGWMRARLARVVVAPF